MAADANSSQIQRREEMKTLVLLFCTVFVLGLASTPVATKPPASAITNIFGSSIGTNTWLRYDPDISVYDEMGDKMMLLVKETYREVKVVSSKVLIHSSLKPTVTKADGVWTIKFEEVKK